MWTRRLALLALISAVIAPLPAADDEKGYTVTATLANQKCPGVPEEPCQVRVVVVNESPELVELSLSDPVMDFGIEVTRKDKRPVKHPITTTMGYDAEGFIGSLKTALLRPGQRHEIHVDLRLSFNLSEPGVYVVGFRPTKREAMAVTAGGKRVKLTKSKTLVEIEIPAKR